MASTPASRRLSKEGLAGWVPQFPDLFEHSPSFNTLTATVHFLQDELTAGRLRSVQLVEEFQRSICLHNGWLGAVYQLATGAIQRAQEMDALRQSGKTLGPLHGIPVLIEVLDTKGFSGGVKMARITSQRLRFWTWELLAVRLP